MFTRAGFNGRHTVVCRAQVRIQGDWRVVSAQLIRFTPGGDLAWHVPGRFLGWGNKVFVNCHDDLRCLVDWHERSVDIDTFHSKLKAAREAGCLAEAA